MRSTPGETAPTRAGRGAPVVQLDPLAEPAQGAGARRARHLDQVLLVDAVRGMGQELGQVAVVGHDEQALAVQVEPPDGEDPGLGRHEGDHRRSALGVRRGADHAGRLVEQVVHQIRGATGTGTPSTATCATVRVDPLTRDVAGRPVDA